MINAKQINIDMDDVKAIPRKDRKELSKFKKFTNWLEYDVWNNIHYYSWRNPKRIVYNFWYFRKEIYNFRDFDYNYNFELFIKSLDRTADNIESSDMVVDANETAESIRNFIRLYKKHVDDDYMEEAGLDWDNFRLEHLPYAPGITTKSTYTDVEYREFRDKADALRKKDFDLLITEFKKFERWWD